VDDPIATAPGSDTEAARLALRQCCPFANDAALPVSVNERPGARYNAGRSNKSLDASGGSASRKLLGAAKGALIRAAASTQTLDASWTPERRMLMKFDPDLARQILIDLEEAPFLPTYSDIELEGHSVEQISYHIMLLAKEGYVDAKTLRALEVPNGK
jgi:hypothetical protein